MAFGNSDSPRRPTFLSDNSEQETKPARFAPMSDGRKPHLSIARPTEQSPAMRPAFAPVQTVVTKPAALSPNGTSTPPRSAQPAAQSVVVDPSPQPVAPPPPAAPPVVAAPPPPPPAPVIPVPAPLDEKVEAAIEALNQHSQQLAEQARADAMEIGFLIAKKILEQELTTSPQPLLALVRAAVRKAGESRKISIRLSPEDSQRIKDASADPKTAPLSLANIEIIDDPSLKLGDILVESDHGSIDGRLSTRLAEIARAIELGYQDEETSS